MQQRSLQNKQNPLVLTFDVGTQSARVMLVDKKGNILCKAQKSYEKPYVSPHPDWAEQDPNFYWNTMCEVSLQLKETHEELWNDIIAVTCTCIRATT
ncbi:MAG: FGGY family carbohydrate kinase, partial [Oscillospiraceae bacterium]